MAYLDPRMSGGGLIGGQRMVAFMARYFGDLEVEELPVPFVAVTTDLRTGHEVWLQEGRLAEVLRTAISLPGLFTPVRRERQWLVDGALVNPVPVSVCRAFGAELVIAANMNGDQLGRLRVTRAGPSPIAGLEADLIAQSRLLQGRGGTVWQQLTRRERSTPSLFSVMVASLNITQDRITRARLAGDPPDVTIRPSSATSASWSSTAPPRRSRPASVPPSTPSQNCRRSSPAADPHRCTAWFPLRRLQARKRRPGERAAAWRRDGRVL